MEEPGSKIKLTIRQSNGEQFEVEVEPSQTVLQLKELCKEKTNLEAVSQRLIFKGTSQVHFFVKIMSLIEAMILCCFEYA